MRTRFKCIFEHFGRKNSPKSKKHRSVNNFRTDNFLFLRCFGFLGPKWIPYVAEAKRNPNGSQRGAKRKTKRIQKGTKMKKAFPKVPFAEQERTNWKKDAKRMPMYAKRVPKWNQNRCPQSLQINEKQITKKFPKNMNNDNKTMPKWNQKFDFFQFVREKVTLGISLIKIRRSILRIEDTKIHRNQ